MLVRQTIVVSFLLLTGNALTAKEKPEEHRQPVDSPRVALEKRFNRSSPAVGSSLPVVSAFDADGNSFTLTELKGNYAVLVFGCLT